MKCAVCGKELERRELAAPYRMGRLTFRVPSLCDGCARAHAYRGGSKESLDRLGTGLLDEAEVARLKEET